MVDCFTQIKIKSYKEEGLAVPKGSNFLILRKQEEKDGPVYIARYDGIDGEIPVKELQDTKMPKWFKDYDRTKAENFLRRPQIKDGEFLIRPAVRGKDGDYSASIKFNQGFQHFKLSAAPNSKGWTIQGQTFSTLQKFVNKFQSTPLTTSNNEKITLSADASTDIVTVIDPSGTYYTEDDYYDDDDDGYKDGSYYQYGEDDDDDED